MWQLIFSQKLRGIFRISNLVKKAFLEASSFDKPMVHTIKKRLYLTNEMWNDVEAEISDI